LPTALESRTRSGCVIIGIGNPIKSDDGIGVEAVRYLEGRLPGDVELVEGSVYCADLFCFLEGRRKVIFIDAIDAGEEPGAIFRFSPDQLRQRKMGIPMSVHDFGPYELIATARLMGQCPDDITFITIQVKNVELGEELSEEVRAAIPRIHELVLEELGGLDNSADVEADEIPEN
jgi:hydrogenase maturation protease